MKTAAVIVFLVCLLATEVQGQNQIHKGRCFCADKGVDVVLRKNIEKFEIIPPSPSCGKREIILIIFIIYFFHPLGQPGFGLQRCLCRGAGAKMVKPKLIEKVEIHPISPSCGHLEVV
ncbi:C-X-C motif chemokine 11-6 [Anabarilius grahami]|uniref:C-X-C motif chemokine 11-6 n=1 Tax=Anabarilius grahami TaxID=495550 RepID=A0A3N0Z0I4_ANAGA|nr:C-X-C motif chemokine 11-6 [Anabarilius grahami]